MTAPASLPQPLPGLPPLLDIRELSAYLGAPVSTIYDWRARGLGPRAYRFGKHLKFAVADVTAWIEAQCDPASSSSPSSPDRR
ncbi:helix-turn-helix transcriptional regulator [Sinomonas notoginsengisoli]|uniref:helix-turn-helix transcriptional regulator n=1 Tax=Sinomonas notoginsengisoli TaxID=1457311 RepID=UPI001F444D3B|nr:helix-turn-helix domain-containing protein [Sinomonas notoginsengisoli]